MTLKGLSEQYFSEAEKIEKQIQKRKAELKRLPEYSARRHILNREILILEDQLVETNITAKTLAHYYEEK